MSEIKAMVEELNSLHGGIHNSVFGLDHWGAKETVAGMWLQPDAKRCIAEKLAEKKPCVIIPYEKLQKVIGCVEAKGR